MKKIFIKLAKALGFEVPEFLTNMAEMEYFDTDNAFEIFLDELAKRYAYIAINITVMINEAIKPKL